MTLPLLEQLPIAVHLHVAAPDELVRRPGPLEKNAWDRAVADGRLPEAKIGRFRYARLSDLLALIERTTQAQSEADPRITQNRRANT